MSKRQLNLFQRLMRHYGLTTRILADRVGASRTAISQFAHGRPPRVDVAILIAREFKVTVEELWSPDSGLWPCKDKLDLTGHEK